MPDEALTGMECGGDSPAPPGGKRAAAEIAPPYDLARARWMFWVAFAYLGVLAAVLPHAGAGKPNGEMALYDPGLPLALFGLWMIVLIEGVTSFAATSDRKQALRRLALTVLLPPFRMAVSARRPNDWVWLPSYGWLAVSGQSVARMEQRTAIPMLIATALIVPVLIIDFGFADVVDASRPLQVALAVLIAVIWFSFALEFIVMVSLAPKKLHYCMKHWINIVIVVLPLFAFLRTLRMLNFLRVAKASQLAKAYRLRGLGTRMLKIALAFNLVDRIMAFNPERHCAALEGKIIEKERELARLRTRLAAARLRADERAAARAEREIAEAGKP